MTTLEKNNLYGEEKIIQSVLNVHSGMQTRHGVMCVGPPMSGKTTAIKTLIQALELLNKEELASRCTDF